jgi:hypothetical protein
MDMKKVIGVLGIILAVAATVLLAMRRISPFVFWLVIGCAFVIAYVMLPRMKK